MSMSWWRVGCAALVAVAIAGCCGGDKKKEDTTSRWDNPSKSATAPAASAPAKPGTPGSTEPKPLEGSAFNKFFPADGTDGTKRVFTQEKTGYAEAKYQKDGKDLVTLSVSDTANNPDARSKFSTATDKLDGHPLMTVGKNQSTILVKDKLQVKASSMTLDADARKTWISKFNLSGLAGL